MPEITDQPIVSGQTTAQNEAVETVLKRLEEGELFVPPYQRDSDEWDHNKKSLFIESILNRLTVPAFYLAPSEADPDRFEVVDGQQRLTTLDAFFTNKYRLESDDDCPYFGTSVQYAGLGNKNHLTKNLALTFRNSTDEVLDIVCAQLKFEDQSFSEARLLPDAMALASDYFPEFKMWWSATRMKCATQVQVSRHRAVALLIPGLVKNFSSPSAVSDTQWGWIGKFVSGSRATAAELGVIFPESKGRWSGEKGQRAQINAYAEVAEAIARK
jgi:hypothetical protein